MSTVRTIRATARVSDYLYRHAFPLYAALYGAYKRVSERAEIACIRRLVGPGDHVADVGANVGFYTHLLGERVGARGTVWAFEPDPDNFARLRAAVRRQPWVVPVQAAVGERGGTVTLYRSPDLNVDHRTYATGEERATVEVDAVALDGFLPTGVPLHFLKMDVQGAEHGALRGMAAVVARSPDLAILTEVWPHVLDRFGAGTRALLALLEAWGFTVHRLAPGGSAGEVVTAAGWHDGGSPEEFFDVLCTRPGGRG